MNDESADYPALAVASYALGDSGSSRLWKRIREKEGLSYGVYAWIQASSFEPNTPLMIEASFAPENRERLAKALAEELSGAVKNGFTDAEVDVAKNSVLKRRQLQRTQDASLAQALVQQAYRGRTFEFTGKVDAAIRPFHLVTGGPIGARATAVRAALRGAAGWPPAPMRRRRARIAGGPRAGSAACRVRAAAPRSSPRVPPDSAGPP